MKRYESAIRVIAAFFAVLLGFGLKQLLDPGSRAQLSSATGPCFIICVLLFLRFLVGSSTHMWVEFVLPDLKTDSTFKAPWWQIVIDFCFLTFFGLLGMAICYSRDLEHFMKLNGIWAFVGVVWSAFYTWLKHVPRQRVANVDAPKAPREDWWFWILINAVQMAALWLLYGPVMDQRWGPVWFWWDWLPQPRWDLALLALLLIYALLLFADVMLQLRVLANARIPATPPASPVAPSDEALILAAAAADSASRGASASVAALAALISKPSPKP